MQQLPLEKEEEVVVVARAVQHDETNIVIIQSNEWCDKYIILLSLREK